MGLRAAFIGSIAVLLCAAPAFASAATLTVTGSSDPGGSCTGTTCTTLRAAITEAGRLTGADVINVPAGVINLTDDYVINSPITIIGAGARTTIIDGGSKYRGFRVSGEGTLQLARFTIRNGAAGGGGFADGGGIYNAGSLALIDVRITNSRAARGAGIANNLGVVQADNLLIDNNVASGAGGGGIHNTGGPELAGQDGWLSLADTTIFKNSATGTGGVGGIASSGTGALIALSRSTIADNVGGPRGVGGLAPTGSSAAVGTILARNLVGAAVVNCGDTKPTDSGFNVEDEADCQLSPGNQRPELASALTNEGGQLDVLTITTGSDAFNLLPGTNGACAGTDQRGLARPKGSACEAGAFELNAGASVRITAGPAGTVATNDVEFRFQDSGGDVTVQCDLTGPGQAAGFEPCYKANAQPYTDLPDGPYTFSVRAVSTEFPSPPVTTRTFVVNEAGPPDTTITGGPSGLTNTAAPTFTFTSTEPGSTFQCRVGSAAFAPCTSPHTTATQSDGPKTFEVRAIDAAGAVDPTPATRAFTVTQVQPAPTPTPTPTPGPPPEPTPVPNQTVVVTPASGTVLVKLKGSPRFEPLDVTKGIPNGSEVDVRKGRVTLTSIPKAGAPPESADFYGGIFIVTQKGGITDLKLSERLTGCPKGRQARLSQKKTKSRKLWGNGKGSFRTTGKYSAATVRGTIWLVQDGCTTTLTRVTAGVVQVNDFVTRKKVLIKKGKRYTARARKR